jgi:plasmid stabilization system protein ParE
VARLANQPGLGRAGRLEGTRELVVIGTPYIVAYRVTSTEIDVLTILHGAQRRPDAL